MSLPLSKPILLAFQTRIHVASLLLWTEILIGKSRCVRTLDHHLSDICCLMAGIAPFGELLVASTESGWVLGVYRLVDFTQWPFGDGVNHSAQRQTLVPRPDTNNPIERLLQFVQFIFRVDPILRVSRKQQLDVPRLHRHGHQITQSGTIGLRRAWRALR